MPYHFVEDLPVSVRAHLPVDVQEIFKENFNHALDKYLDEYMAFKVAWAAIKKRYRNLTLGMWEKF